MRAIARSSDVPCYERAVSASHATNPRARPAIWMMISTASPTWRFQPPVFNGRRLRPFWMTPWPHLNHGDTSWACPAKAIQCFRRPMRAVAAQTTYRGLLQHRVPQEWTGFAENDRRHPGRHLLRPSIWFACHYQAPSCSRLRPLMSSVIPSTQSIRLAPSTWDHHKVHLRPTGNQEISFHKTDDLTQKIIITQLDLSIATVSCH